MKKELGKREIYYPYDRLSGAKLRGAKLEFIIHSQCQAYSHDFNEPSFVKIGSVVLEISQVEYFILRPQSSCKTRKLGYHPFIQN